METEERLKSIDSQLRELRKAVKLLREEMKLFISPHAFLASLPNEVREKLWKNCEADLDQYVLSAEGQSRAWQREIRHAAKRDGRSPSEESLSPLI